MKRAQSVRDTWRPLAALLALMLGLSGCANMPLNHPTATSNPPVHSAVEAP